MKNQYSLMAMSAAAIIASGCQGDPVQPRDTTKLSDVLAVLGLSSNTGDINALLRFSVTKIYDDRDSASSTTASAVTQGIFADDSMLTDVTGVSLNSEQFDHDAPGFYSHVDPAIPQNGQLSWAVTGYRGSNLTRVTSMAGPLDITGLKAGDTVSKSTGFTVNYTGNNGGAIEASMDIDDGLTYLWVHPDSVIVGGEQALEMDDTDDGSISFTSGGLQNFPVGRIYVVSVRQSRWDVDSTLVHSKVGIYSSYQVQVPLYLAP